MSKTLVLCVGALLAATGVSLAQGTAATQPPAKAAVSRKHRHHKAKQLAMAPKAAKTQAAPAPVAQPAPAPAAAPAQAKPWWHIWG